MKKLLFILAFLPIVLFAQTGAGDFYRLKLIMPSTGLSRLSIFDQYGYIKPLATGSNGQVLMVQPSGSVDWSSINIPTKVSQLENDLGFIGDAPANGFIYGRKNNAWEQITSQWINATYGLRYGTETGTSDNIGIGTDPDFNNGVFIKKNILGASLYVVNSKNTSSSSNAIVGAVNNNTDATYTFYGYGFNSSGNGAIVNGFTAKGALLTIERDAPSTPASGYSYVYAKSNGILYFKNDAGTEYDLTAGGTGYTPPVTTKGDLFTYSTVPYRLGIGTNNQVLTVDTSTATGLKWATPSSGFADPMTTRGDIIYRNSSNTTARLGLGTNGQVLKSNGTDLVWGSEGSSAWIGDTYGIYYSNNIGIGQNSVNTAKVIINGATTYAMDVFNSANGIMSNISNTTDNYYSGIFGTTSGVTHKFTGGGALMVIERSSSPSTPASGYSYYYTKTDGKPYFKNDSGTEYDLSATGAGSGTPGGNSGSIQYNNGGAFGGFGNWNGSTVSITGAISATSNIISSAAVGTTGGGGSIGITGGYMYMPNMTAPSAPVSGMGYLYVAGTPGQEKIYFKNSTQAAYDLTLIGTGLTNPMTTKGDMIYGTTGGAAARLAAGTDGYYLRMQSGVPTWVSSSYTLPTASNSVLGGVQVSSTDGGLSMYSNYLAMNLNNLTSASLDLGDSFAFYDVSGTATRKATLNDLKTLIGSGGSGGAPTDATYITQTANALLSNEQALGSLATGIMKSTNTTGVVSTIAASAANQYLRRNASNTDYEFGSAFTLTTNGSSGAATYDGVTLNIPQYAGGGSGMVYPGSGIPISTGSAWGTSITDNSSNWNTAYTDRLKWDGGSSGLVASTGRTSLGGTTIGQSMFTLANPSAITFPRFNADNTVSALSASDFRTAIGFGSYIENQNSTYQTANAKISGTYTSSARNAFFIGSKLMLSDYTWGGISTNVWIGGATNNTVTGSFGYEGNSNIAIGLYALSSNTTGYQNNAIGVSALSSNTTGIYNTAIGGGALGSNTTGYSNTAIGVSALNFNTVGNGNNAIGFGTLGNNTTGNYNTAIGISSLTLNSTGSYNNAIGHLSMYSNESGYQNNAIGYNALYFNTTGIGNNAIGSNALYSSTTSNYNNALGNESLYRNTIGTFNNAIGFQALYNNTTGQSNSAFGHNTGKGITTGSNNTIIGANVVGLSGNLSNNIIIATGDGIARATFDGYNWKLSGSTQVGDDSTAASSTNVGAIRYRTSGNNSYCEMVMQTGASTYAWVVIKQNSW